ncbi:MAG TPA: hypothetical protein VM580_23830 [Labilithrix sp.]|nr:hypothetical protein [Labilithrix sp.]
MRRKHSGIAARTFVFAVLLGTNARAADPNTLRARALFDEAGELERRGQWSAAADRLRAALRLRDTPHLHYALGWALENDDKLLDAKVEYETAARLGAERAGGAEAARLANARLAELEKKLPVFFFVATRRATSRAPRWCARAPARRRSAAEGWRR